jgi:hypothetical protein
MSSEDITDILNHEMAHFVGPNAPNDITDQGGMYGDDALTLNYERAMKSASCHAWLAWLARKPSSEWQK